MPQRRTEQQQASEEINRELGSMPEPVECEVEPLGAGWRLHFAAQRIVVEVPRTYWHSNGQVDANYSILVSPLVGADGPRRIDHGTLNLHSSPTRARLAKQLETRGHDAPWQAVLDEFASRVVELVTAGEEPVVLTDLDVGLQPENRLLGDLCIEGEPSMVFGHGGDGKSLLALACGASLAGGYGLLDIEPARRMPVAYLDWEWRPEEHARRLRQLLGVEARLPNLWHFQCRRPLAAIVDGLAVKFRRYGIQYAIVDSVAWACGGAPEKSEMATAFQAALRQLRVGALCVAHTNRSGDTTMPFGSVFWWNAMRSIWYLKRMPSGERTLAIEMHHRKSNSAHTAEPMAYVLTWDDSGRVAIAKGDVKRVPPLKERIKEALERVGLPMTPIELALAVGPGTDGRQPREDAIVTVLGRDNGKTFAKIDGTPPRWVLGGSFSFAGSNAREDNEGTPLDPAVERQMNDGTTPARTSEASSLEVTSRELRGEASGPSVTPSGERPSDGQRSSDPERLQPGDEVREGGLSGGKGEEHLRQLSAGRDLLAGFEERGLKLMIRSDGRLGVGPPALVDEEVRAMLADVEVKAAVVAALKEESR